MDHYQRLNLRRKVARDAARQEREVLLASWTTALVRELADKLNTTVKDIMGYSRHKEHVHARQAIMFVMVKKLKFSSADVGRQFRKDHTTVLHAIHTAVPDKLRKKLCQRTLRAYKIAVRFIVRWRQSQRELKLAA